MFDRSEWTLELVLLILLIALVLLVLAFLHRRHLHRISRQIADLPPAPEGTERILTAIEGARMQISSTGDELRGQNRTIKDRINWLIGQYDRLIALLVRVLTPKEPK